MCVCVVYKLVQAIQHLETNDRFRDSSHERGVPQPPRIISSHEEVMRSRLMRIAIRKWRLGHYIKWKFNWSQTIMRCARNHAGQEWHSLCVSAALTPSPPSLSRASLFSQYPPSPCFLPPSPPLARIPSFSSTRARLRVSNVLNFIYLLSLREAHTPTIRNCSHSPQSRNLDHY